MAFQLASFRSLFADKEEFAWHNSKNISGLFPQDLSFC